MRAVNQANDNNYRNNNHHSTSNLTTMIQQHPPPQPADEGLKTEYSSLLDNSSSHSNSNYGNKSTSAVEDQLKIIA
ncbi:2007_t:CDS:2, partial [Entrophospora sp. SA101]